jgi:hypothetical protein
MAGFLGRIDDAINPIVVKELRQAVKSRFVVAVLIIFLLLQLGWIGLQLLVLGFQGRIESLDFQGGRDVFMALQVILMATCLLFIPLYTAIRLAAERNEANVDLLFVTTIQPRSIIAGKLFSAIVLSILIFSACMPFMGLTYYLRGIDWATILYILAIDFVVVIVCVQLMVFLAVVPANIVFRALLGIFGLGCLLTVFISMMGTTSMMLYFSANVLGDSEFWYGSAGILVLIAAVGGLFFTWSVALVSSPSSNRALGVRIYMFALTIVSAAIAIGLAYGLRDLDPFVLWIWVAAILASIYAIIAINERREWSARVLRRIPKTFLSRLFVFPLFSGAAGGLLFSVLMMGIIFFVSIGYYSWGRMTPSRHWRADWRVEASIEATAQLFTYTYCYCLTAVFVHRVFLPRLKPTLTWVVLLAIVAIGMVAPYIALLFAMLDRWDHDNQFYWLLTNPVHALYETMSGREMWIRNHRTLVVWMFLVLWAGIITLLNVRWFVRQFAQFRRVEFAPPPEAPPVAPATAHVGDAVP